MYNRGMPALTSTRTGNFLGFFACAGLMAYALYVQYVMGLEPCPLCIFQRVAVIALGFVFLVAALHNPGRAGAKAYGVLQLVVALAGIAISIRHAWIQAQPPGTVAACGAGLSYMLEVNPLTDVIKKVLTGSGECGRVDWRFLGLSMPWWVLFSLVALGGWAATVNFRKRRAF